MSSESIVNRCKDLRLKHSIFKKYNYPARIITIAAIIIPLAILVPTSPNDEKGEADYTQSPYAIHSGIIFLAGVGIAFFLSRKASGYKVRTYQIWAICALNVFENLNEYQRKATLKDYRDRAENNLNELINDMQIKIDEADDKIKWIIPFVNPVEEISSVLENNILPIVEGGDKNEIPKVKDYLVNLMKYLLYPSKSVPKELLAGKIPQTETIEKELEEKHERPLPYRNISLFGLFFGIGIATYFLALTLEVDKNTAFLAGAGLTGALCGGYFVYMKK